MLTVLLLWMMVLMWMVMIMVAVEFQLVHYLRQHLVAVCETMVSCVNEVFVYMKVVVVVVVVVVDVVVDVVVVVILVYHTYYYYVLRYHFDARFYMNQYLPMVE